MGGNFSKNDEKTTPRKNVKFYSNKLSTNTFGGNNVEDMLGWKGDYKLLESKHDYIQWLFPIPGSRGMNWSAQQLYDEEAKEIREDETMRKRVLAAYKIMLDFYGMELECEETGCVKRNPENWKARYEHLNRSPHNYRRITRILISLGELGYPHYQAMWVGFLMKEVIVNRKLLNGHHSSMRYWISAVREPLEQELVNKTHLELIKSPKNEQIDAFFAELKNIREKIRDNGLSGKSSEVTSDESSLEETKINVNHEDERTCSNEFVKNGVYTLNTDMSGSTQHNEEDEIDISGSKQHTENDETDMSGLTKQDSPLESKNHQRTEATDFDNTPITIKASENGIATSSENIVGTKFIDKTMRHDEDEANRQDNKNNLTDSSQPVNNFNTCTTYSNQRESEKITSDLNQCDKTTNLRRHDNKERTNDLGKHDKKDNMTLSNTHDNIDQTSNHNRSYNQTNITNLNKHDSKQSVID